ncbi:MAG: prephenate dehydrogenase/arogenate dehydrogenase family protein [Verrucomicrobiales bacterium]|nr:prephenate dehydrogenase/arogenate dehydrogenase family protein [Verrucomicrobiales bacterium]
MGPGLIGGSVLKGVRKRFPEVELSAWARRNAVVEALRKDFGSIDLASPDLEEAIAGADLVILAMPTGVMADVVKRISRFPETTAKRPVMVTDVGSVKGPVVSEIAPLVRERGGVFLGSHPMAGSEKAGLEYAEDSLLEDAAVILTPEKDRSSAADIEKVTDFWESLGGRVSTMEAGEHDRLVASISHLPHLLAASLVRVVLRENPDAASFSGGGLRDTTRVSAGPEEMWSGILCDNQEAVSRKLEELICELGIWKDALDSLDRDKLRSFLSEARQLRETF